MPRYKLLLEYDGTDFVGWQRQNNGFAVQQALEEAVVRFSRETVVVHGAGRTDSGVHAYAQVAHIDLDRTFPAEKVCDALNYHLKPHKVCVREVHIVDDDFHARFSATSRAYLYRIINRRPPLVLEKGKAWWVPTQLDAYAMHEAAQVLVGTHDFTSFRAAACQSLSPVKTLDTLDVSRIGDEIQMVVKARSFLHHQVRNFAGTLRLVGLGKWTADDVRAALEARTRARGGPTAPACGLYLTDVIYD